MSKENQITLNSNDIREKFLQIEKSNGLLDKKEGDVYYWELVRYNLYTGILVNKGLQHSANKGIKINIPWFLKCIKLFFISITNRNPIKSPRNALLFIGHPRKKHENGEYVDIYVEPFLTYAPDNYKYAVMERPFDTGIHFTPPANKNILYLDAIVSISGILRLLFPYNLSFQTREYCKKIQQEFQDQLGVDINVENYVIKAITKYKYETLLFRWLFRRLRPVSVFLVVSIGNEAIVSAARSLKIPTAELQHGSPAAGKLNYDYPSINSKRYFPDYFLSFGPFWTATNVSLPLPKENIIPVGFPYMHLKRTKYADVMKKDQIVILSQPNVAHILADFTRDLADNIKDGIKIVYKIHPQEYNTWESEYAHLKNTGVTLLNWDCDLYQLLAESRWQVGVYSTALYEGVAFSCKTFIVNYPGAEYMKPLVDAGLATLVDSAAEVTLDRESNNSSSTILFPEVTTYTIAAAIDRILKSGETFSA